MIKVILVIIILILFLKKDNIEELCANRYLCQQNTPNPNSNEKYDLIDLKDKKIIPHNQTSEIGENLCWRSGDVDNGVFKINGVEPNCESRSSTDCENENTGCFFRERCLEADSTLKGICKQNFDENLSDELYINDFFCENNNCNEDDFKVNGVCCKTACKFKNDLYYNLYLNNSPSPSPNPVPPSPIKKYTCVTNYDCNCDYTNNYCIDNQCVSLKPKLEIEKLKWILILTIAFLLFFVINPVLISGFIFCIIFLMIAFYFGFIIYTHWIIFIMFIIFFIFYVKI